VKEQSHKTEMGAALRGDFERLRARGGAGVMTAPEPTQPVAEPVPDTVVERVPEPVAVEREPAVVEAPAEAPVAPDRPSWFGRLRDRL
jgi:hypothetical protein